MKGWLIRLVQGYNRTKKRLKATFSEEVREPLIVHGQILGEIRAFYIGMTPDGYTVGNVHGTKFDGKLLARFFADVGTWRDVLKAYDEVCYRIYHNHGIDVLQAQTRADIPDNLVKLFLQGSFIQVCTKYDSSYDVDTIIWRKGIYGTRPGI